MTAITTTGSYEFNFVFKDGQKSDAPVYHLADYEVEIDPP